MVKRDGSKPAPVLKNPFLFRYARSLIFHYPNRWTTNEDEAISWTCAIRKGAWKLLYLMKQKKLELYNLSADIGEKNNLALVYPEQLARLATLLGNELRQRAAQMPIWKETGKPVAWPDELLAN